MLLFKFCGMSLLFGVCTLWGFLKAAALKKRAEKLSDLQRNAAKLKELIRSGGGEITPLLRAAFPPDQLEFTENRIQVNKTYLKEEDVSLLEDFLNGIGMGDVLGVCQRISAYANLIKQRSDEAAKECEVLCRLYKSLGALIGLFICIFFL